MRESGRLALDDEAPMNPEECTLDRVDDASYEAWLESVAARTEGFSGAALAAVVRAAVARALDRTVTLADVGGCRVTASDFDQAIADVRTSSLELEEQEVEAKGSLAEPTTSRA